MRRRFAKLMMFVILLFTMTLLTHEINIVRASALATIYVRPDGSVDPPTSPISRNGDLYTLNADVYQSHPNWLDEYGIIIQKDNVILDGANHLIQGYAQYGSWNVGIAVDFGHSNVTIENARIRGFEFGIVTGWIEFSTIVGNDIDDCREWGITVGGLNNVVANNTLGSGITSGVSTDLSVLNNNLTNCNIQIWRASYAQIDRNCLRNSSSGIILEEFSSNCQIVGNNLENDYADITIQQSSNNTVAENNITNTANWEGVPIGINLEGSNNNTIRGNEISGQKTYQGICLGSSSNNIISENTLSETQSALTIFTSSNNTIYHNNFVNNTSQVVVSVFDNQSNLFDNGYPSGGNYWSDYGGADIMKGQFQNETGSDEIGDVPYTIDANNLDHYPLVNAHAPNHSPSTPDKPQWADTEQILTTGQSAQFTTSATDPGGDQVRITYDWGDGTPTWQSNLVPSGTAVTKDHSWSQTGMFEVKAIATDPKGAESGWSSPLEVTVVVRQDATIWSGYCVQYPDNDVWYVEGEWTQPSYNINPFINLFGSTSTWIGIGGVGSGSCLLQAGIGYWGTHEDLLLRMHPFWMTQGPDGKGAFFFDTSKSASVGDLIQASISLRGNNQWTIYIQDLTGTGWVFSATVNCVSDQKTAEWIHEIAGAGSSLIGFSPVAFSRARFDASVTTYRVGDEHSALRMFYNLTSGVTCTTVSEITNYETFTISDTGNRPASSTTPITSIFSLHSSAEMYVYDSQNRYDGYNITSGYFDLGIPNSYFFVDDNGTQLAVLSGLDEYRVVLNGTENGDFHLHIESYVNSTENTNLWENDTITIGATRTYYVNTISEFPTSMILPFFLIATLLAALILRRKEAEKSDKSVSQPYVTSEWE